ncbi:reverse transcriptase domain-containing protein [Tanacetum coccineum]
MTPATENRRQETFKTYATANGYTGNCPLCERNKRPATRNNLQSVSITCNVCGKKGHYANQCSKANNRAIRKLLEQLAFIHFRISTLETTLEDIQVSSESSSI